jgi:hypothetical protein
MRACCAGASLAPWRALPQAMVLVHRSMPQARQEARWRTHEQLRKPVPQKSSRSTSGRPARRSRQARSMKRISAEGSWTESS